MFGQDLRNLLDSWASQAGEKYPKSYMIARGLEFQRIHDLPVLLRLCWMKDSSLQVLVDDCKILNRFYIDTRYPVDWPTNFPYLNPRFFIL
ncbi:MAG: HEPN domain-containing protein [Deltaproteobacteria bacterium]|nr:HEPN domain-containing protein [Deltaproteobacteria bacterium]MBW2339519.1 HEPN domain-containing protein [Deltaproteobacteria bacterium]